MFYETFVEGTYHFGICICVFEDVTDTSYDLSICICPFVEKTSISYPWRIKHLYMYTLVWGFLILCVCVCACAVMYVFCIPFNNFIVFMANTTRQWQRCVRQHRCVSVACPRKPSSGLCIHPSVHAFSHTAKSRFGTLGEFNPRAKGIWYILRTEGLFGVSILEINKGNILLNHLALSSEIMMLNMLSAKLKDYCIF